MTPPLPRRYRTHLRAVVAAAAAPYGYTLTVWTSGAVTSNAEGLPSAPEALLFLAGAVGGFALVGMLAHGGASRVLRPGEREIRLWGGFHLPAVGAAIGGATLVVSLVRGWPAWPLVGLVATSLYLLVIAAQFALADAAAAPSRLQRALRNSYPLKGVSYADDSPPRPPT